MGWVATRPLAREYFIEFIRRERSKGDKIIILNEKIDLLRSKKFKIFSQINRNSTSNRDFLVKFVM